MPCPLTLALLLLLTIINTKHRIDLDEAIISQASKSKMRGELEAIQRELASLKNRQMMAAVDGVIKATKDEVAALVKAGTKTAVLKMDIGSDAKAIKRAMDEIKKVAEDMSYLGVAAEADKITVFAVVSDEAQKAGIKANDWVTAAISSYGGRGGGRPGMAQGSTPEASDAALQGVLESARKYLAKA